LTPGVYDLLTRQLIEVVAFDGVNEPERLPLGRNEVVPPARGHVTATAQAGEPHGDRVRAVKVVE
jgi:hypothetical protein